MDRRAKVIAVGAVVLVLVMFFAVLLSDLFRRTKVPSQESSNTLLPTRYVEKQEGFEGQISPTPIGGGETDVDKTQVFTADELQRLSKFQKKLPYRSEDFDIGYSSLLNKYFIQTKTAQADMKIEAFMKQNTIADIYHNRVGLFVVGEKPIYEQIKQAEVEFSKNQ